jgi:hypothetical protein
LVSGNIYYASQTLNSCESSRTAVTANINTTAAPTASSPQTFCNAATVANLTATGTAIKWYDAATNGNLLASSTALVSGNVYYASQTLNSCESSRTAVTANINTTAAPTATASQSFCGSATVADLMATGTDIKWYDAATNGNLLSSSTALVSGNVYYASQTLNSCESSRTAVTAIIITIDTTISINGTTLTANQSGATYQWYECPNIIIDGARSQSYTPPSSGGTYSVVIGLNNCLASSLCAVVLGTEDFTESKKALLYPNPSKGLININTVYEGDLEVVDNLGRVVKTFKVVPNITNSVNVENLKDGIYFIKETKGNTFSTLKLIIRK